MPTHRIERDLLARRIDELAQFGKTGDRIIITAGVPLRTPGSTNMLRIAYIGSQIPGR